MRNNMRNSGILKWTSKGSKSSSSGKGGKDEKWIHAPEALTQGHVVYLVKFLGNTEVDQPKGIDVVKQGIQKLKFSQQLKKSEGNAKTPKVELTISVDGVAIQDPKSKLVLHQYPLHKISYCADDKAEKKFFSFIAKEGESSQHTCYVFVSDKLAEDITLTIGQAFELAYKKFLDSSGKAIESKKQMLVMQKRIALLEKENSELKKRLKDIASIKGQADIAEYMKKLQISDITEIRDEKNKANNEGPRTSESSASLPNVSNMKSSPNATPNASTDALIFLDSAELEGFSPGDIKDEEFNPRASSDDDDDDDDEEDIFDPRAPDVPAPTLAPPPSSAKVKQPQQTNYQQNLSQQGHAIFSKDDPFGKNPFQTNAGNNMSNDPFGMASFNASAPIQPKLAVDKALHHSFSLDDLDPLKK